MKSVILYYFSGSGNTFQVMTKVKNTFENHGYKCVVERIEDVESVDFTMYKYVGLLFPVAIQSTYPFVWDFIHDLPITQGQKIFMIDTMVEFSGGVVGPIKKVLQAKGYDCVAAIEVKMSNSMQTKEISLEEMKSKNRDALKTAEQFVVDMLNGKCHWSRVPLLSDWMRNLSKSQKLWIKTSKRISINNDKCVLCKVCVRNCPVGALNVIDGKVTINHNICVSCMRCVHQCPKNAFAFDGKEVKRPI